MRAGEGEALHNPIRRQTLLRRLLIAAAAILGVSFGFVIMASVVHSPGNRPHASPALATVAMESFSAVASAAGVLQLGSGSSFVLSAPFPLTEDAQLAVGQSATVTVDALPGLTFPAKVVSIDPSELQVNGLPAYRATIALTTTDPRLRYGQTATVNVAVASVGNVLTVPTQALFTNANGALQVDVWYQGAPVATTLTIGLVGNTLTQITSGLQQGEQVMLSPVGETLQSPARPT